MVHIKWHSPSPSYCPWLPPFPLYKPAMSPPTIHSFTNLFPEKLERVVILSHCSFWIPAMACGTKSSLCLYLTLFIVMVTISSPVSAQLSVSFYANTCPSVFDTVRTAVRSAINREARMGASLLRMFFHDCFVNVSFYVLWYLFD